MTMYREPNRLNIPFPEGLPSSVEVALIAHNAVKSVDTGELNLASNAEWDLKVVGPDLIRERADKLMFKWLNGDTTPGRMRQRRFDFQREMERKDWLSKVGLLTQYNLYLHGPEAYKSDPINEELFEKLRPTVIGHPVVLEREGEPEEGEELEDVSNLIVLRGIPYFAFELFTDQPSQMAKGRRNTNKILPAVFSSKGFSMARIDADLPDSYSELSAWCGKRDVITPANTASSTVLSTGDDPSTYTARNLSQALTLALTLPEKYRVRFDSAGSVTKTDALITRAADLILKPIHPSSEGYGGSDVESSVVALRGVHALFKNPRNALSNRRDMGSFTNFVAHELTRSRFYPTGPRAENFQTYAELAVSLAGPMDMDPFRILKAIHKAAPK